MLDRHATAQRAQRRDTFAVLRKLFRWAIRRGDPRRLRAGVAIWNRSVPALETLAETYAEHRGIVKPLPETVQLARLSYRNQETGAASRGDVPGMVCALQDAGGVVVGVQRIYLADDGLGKLAVRKPKLSLGNMVGSASRPSGFPNATEKVLQNAGWLRSDGQSGGARGTSAESG